MQGKKRGQGVFLAGPLKLTCSCAYWPSVACVSCAWRSSCGVSFSGFPSMPLPNVLCYFFSLRTLQNKNGCAVCQMRIYIMAIL